MTRHPPTSPTNHTAARANATDQRLLEAIEFYRRELDSGRWPARDELLAEYHDVGQELIECLDSLEFVYQVAPSLRESEESRATEAAVEPRACLGDFRIVREIGRGGMGVVYLAEQMSLARLVALKVLPFASMLDRRQLERFRNEAKVAASLKHPRIVSVISVGYERGVHYYVMELVEGESLAMAIRRMSDRPAGWNRRTESVEAGSNSLNTSCGDTEPAICQTTLGGPGDVRFYESVARLGIDAADALDYSHQMGLVHRDIKPSNLLVDREGHLWVTDFGLAMTQTSDNLTVSGDVPGTLRYMSPEQALGRRAVLDHRTDIYSLGATLYELTTGHPAIEGDDRQTILRNILERDPVGLRQHSPAIPRDLETVIAKAMAKESGERYETAAELADDLRRFLAGEPIQARRTRTADRLWRWGRRNRMVAALLLTLLTLVVMLAVAGPLVAIRQTDLARRERQARLAVDQTRQELQTHLSISNTSAAYTAFYNHDLGLSRKLLGRNSPPGAHLSRRDFAWRFLHGMLERAARTPTLHHPDGVTDVAFSPDGKWVATACRDSVIRLWRATDWSLANELLGHRDVVFSLSFSPDGTELMSGGWDGQVILWDVGTRRPKDILMETTGRIFGTAWSPDSRWIAVDMENRELEEHSVTLLETASRSLRTIAENRRHLGSLEFSSDSTILAAACQDGRLSIWDVATGEVYRDFEHPWQCSSSAFLPESRLVASIGSSSWITLWDVQDDHERRRLWGDIPLDCYLACSPNGETLASGGKDGIVRLWNIQSGEVVDTIAAHAGNIYDLAFSPDGRTLVSCSDDETAKVWNLSERATNSATASATQGWQTAIDVSPDGSLLAVGTGPWLRPRAPGSLSLWDLGTGHLRIHFVQQSDPVFSVAFSPVAPLLATNGGQIESQGQVRIWDVTDGSLLRTLVGHTAQGWRVTFSPNGDVLASTSRDGTVRLWNPYTGEQLDYLKVGIPDARRAFSISADFSHNGSTLAMTVGNFDLGQVQLWDMTPRRIATLASWTTRAQYIRYSSDGRWLVANNGQGQLSIWRTEDRRLTRTLSFRAFLNVFAISPDSRVLAVDSGNRDVALWDLESGGQLGILRAESPVNTLCFTPDGNALVGGCWNRTVTLWRAPSRSASGAMSSVMVINVDQLDGRRIDSN